VVETLVPGASVSEIARRHNMNAYMLFNWRREARQGRLPAVAS
jgi:transposase